MPLLHQSAFDILQEGSLLLLHAGGRDTQPLGMSDGFLTDQILDGAVLYKQVYLNKWSPSIMHAWMELHCTSMHIWLSGARSANIYDVMALLLELHKTCRLPSSSALPYQNDLVAVALDQQAWMIARHHARVANVRHEFCIDDNGLANILLATEHKQLYV